MTLVLEKPFSSQKINSWLAKQPSRKSFNAEMFAGKIFWDENPLDYQKRLRNEWEQNTLRHQCFDYLVSWEIQKLKKNELILKAEFDVIAEYHFKRVAY